MALPESVGGDGATMVDLTLVAEELGRSLAPVPWIDHVCTARLLARLGALDKRSPIITGEQIAGLDAQLDSTSGVRLIPTGSVADHVVLRDGEDVVLLTFGTRPAKVDNIGRLPMAWVDPSSADGRLVLATGAQALAEYQRALDEWRGPAAPRPVGVVGGGREVGRGRGQSRSTPGV